MEITLDMELKKEIGIVLDWEEVGGRIEADRAKVPGGWLVVVGGIRGGGITFVPDAEYKWK